ncbi:hypothetical protein [Salipaludibacillus agaradhaerens]|jgi:hypothetical protein|uniref:hypothetical protein n=1 Tax=Salipaludibacillus agaradhaerens TaxID=76935 RepID=UPI0021508B14|nr:hypothetical protein [Salipaludibacillus agaradhaerens]
MKKLFCICENCDKKKTYDWNEQGLKQAFDEGWDYPPFMYEYAVVSPRTCGECSVLGTVWWELEACGTPVEKLNEDQKETLQRILNEPKSITIND